MSVITSTGGNASEPPASTGGVAAVRAAAVGQGVIGDDDTGAAGTVSEISEGDSVLCVGIRFTHVNCRYAGEPCRMRYHFNVIDCPYLLGSVCEEAVMTDRPDEGDSLCKPFEDAIAALVIGEHDEVMFHPGLTLRRKR